MSLSATNGAGSSNRASSVTTETTAEDTLSRLSLEQKVSLLAGKQYWRTPGIPEHNVKAIKFSDGPNGVRGESIHASTKAYCFPCGACVGATFNASLPYDMGKAMGKECVKKNVGVLLGPTVNLHRSPLGGRNFEAYSEDPTLSGVFGAAYVNGVQSQNVSACPKHFVCNECEKYRKTSNTIIDQKTLREMYAYAFQIILKHSNPWTIMSSYNKVNGVSMSENVELLQGLLRNNWEFKGAVISDFEGVYSTSASVSAGCDVEMPGAPLCRGKHLLEAVHNGYVSEAQIDFLALNVIRLAARVGMADESALEKASDMNSDTTSLVRQIASEGIVLLKNEKNILPLQASQQPRIAVFGTPANTPIIHGGGSATVVPTYVISPLKALKDKFGDANVTYHPGVPIFKKIPSAPLSIMKTETNGKPGVDCFWYNGSTFGESDIHHEILETTRTLVIEPRIKELQERHCSRMCLILTPVTSGRHTFGVTACGATIIKVDGKQILSHPGFDDVRVEYIMQPGDFEVRADVNMTAGQDYHVVIDTLSTTAPIPSPVFTVTPQATQVGFYENLNSPPSDNLQKLAATSDISIVFVANNKEYESESFDRESLSLSRPQNDLISTVADACPKTVVVSQTGAPISMPWLDRVDAVLQCWFAGQEVGNALADIISGTVSPSGKLPVTFPVRVEDSPSYGNFPTDESHEIRYAEGLNIGYRARSAPAPMFPFGFGLSYTTFDVSDFTVDGDGSCNATVGATVRNTGLVTGQEVVQVYVDAVLKAFEKVNLKAGQSERVQIRLDKYAFSEWSVGRGAWIASARAYTIDIREHARSVCCTESYSLVADHVWYGL